VDFGHVLDDVYQGVIFFYEHFLVRFSYDFALGMFGLPEFFLAVVMYSSRLLLIHPLLPTTPDILSAVSGLSMELSGGDAYFLLSATSMGTTHEYILVINDISSLRQLGELRKQFVTDISHEMKTPVSVIRANSETFSSTGAIKVPKLAEKFLNSILNNSERLSEMLDDLFELEKIEFGGLVLNRKKFNVSVQIDLILESQPALADENKINITNHIDQTLSLKVA
jgi:Signal transduction histidine kinase